jgi:hypothetical protein
VRREDWPEVLDARVEEARRRAFSWDEHDCVGWAVGTAEAMTGRPIMPWHDPYKDAKGALKALKALGCADVSAFAEKYFGGPIAPAAARRGDVVLLPSGQKSWPYALGVCLGPIAAAPGPLALEFRPMADATAAWVVD